MSISSPPPPQIGRLASAVVQSPQRTHIAGVGHEYNTMNSRSSSLSDLENIQGSDAPMSVLRNESADVDDTEAETERLDESPEKAGRQRNVVLTSTSANPTSTVEDSAVLTEAATGEAEIPMDHAAPQTSEISSLGDPASGRTTPSPYDSQINSRKRKRAQSEVSSINDTVLTMSPIGKESLSPEPLRPSAMLADVEDAGTLAEDQLSEDFDDDERESTISPAPDKQVDTVLDAEEQLTNAMDNENAHGVNPALVDTFEDADSNEEDVAMEEVDDTGEADTVQRNEVMFEKKKAATRSLGDINRLFTALTEKLFVEKLAKLDHELEMLRQPEPAHPEILAAIQVIDQYRNDKIQYEIVRRRLKMKCLSKQSVAEKAQCHSQHQQSVREIRERHVEELNREQSQIQCERRDLGLPPYAKTFPTKRSQQIRQQQAYNLEVSVLSGAAKYVGFPAAPELRPAMPSEAEEDLAFIKSLQPTFDPRRGSLTSMASFQRQRSNIDEQRFLEQTPWANPQHPAHTLSHSQSVFSRPQSPTITPAVHRRVTDSTIHESGSTLPDAASAPTSSILPTPASADPSTHPIRAFRNYTPSQNPEPTPSKQITAPSAYTFLETGSKRGSGRRNPISIDEDPTGDTKAPDQAQSDHAAIQAIHLTPQLSYPEVKMEERPIHDLYHHHQHRTPMTASTVS